MLNQAHELLLIISPVSAIRNVKQSSQRDTNLTRYSFTAATTSMFITDRIRRMGEGNSFSLLVCFGSEGTYPGQGVPTLTGGGYPKVGTPWPR